MNNFLIAISLISISLALTIILECGLIFACTKNKNLTQWVGICNIITNPALNGIMLSIYQITGSVDFWILGFLELAVVAIEGYILKYIGGYRFAKAIKISIFINAVSFFSGLAISAFL